MPVINGFGGIRIPQKQITDGADCKAFPIEYWQRSKTDPQEVYFSQEDWRLRGCRPANHPQKRIMQYANLWQVNPDWMNDLEKDVRSIED